MASIEYRGELISTNSEAYKFHQNKDFKALDKHLKELTVKGQELIRAYDQKLKVENKPNTPKPEPEVSS